MSIEILITKLNWTKLDATPIYSTKQSPDKRFNKLNNSPTRAFWVIVFPGKTPWNDQILRCLRMWTTTAIFSWFFFGTGRFLCIFYRSLFVDLFFATGNYNHHFCSLFKKKRENVKMAWRHNSGLFRVFFSLEQNVWNTFQVFRNCLNRTVVWVYSVYSFSGIGSIERTLRGWLHGEFQPGFWEKSTWNEGGDNMEKVSVRAEFSPSWKRSSRAGRLKNLM